MTDTDILAGPAEQASDDGPRPDAGRLIKRLQDLVGEQTGQLMQYEDLVAQLQEQVTKAAR
jgi:hypothetical protein